MRRTWCLLPLTAVLLAGCSGSGSTSDSGSYSAAAPGAELATPDDAAEPRQVVTTASASLVVDDPRAGAQQVSELVEDAGGRVDQRSEQAGAAGGPGDLPGERPGDVADLVVRVPADELTDLLRDLEDLGEVGSVSITRDDVTGTALDLDARISALQTSADRLEALMAGATTTEALLDAEQALSERQQELESLQSQRTALADQVELSTLAVHLAQTEAAADPGRSGFLGGLDTGWQALTTAVGGAVVVLGVLLPWLVVAGLVAVVAVPLVRRSHRRRARATAPPPEPSQR